MSIVVFMVKIWIKLSILIVSLPIKAFRELKEMCRVPDLCRYLKLYLMPNIIFFLSLNVKRKRISLVLGNYCKQIAQRNHRQKEKVEMVQNHQVKKVEDKYICSFLYILIKYFFIFKFTKQFIKIVFTTYSSIKSSLVE